MNEQDQEVVEVLSDPQMEVLASRSALTLDMAGQGGGKSRNIGYDSGMMVQEFPQARGFIGANTSMQLSQSTLSAVFATWAQVYGFTEYDAKTNPLGTYVVDKRPPAHFIRYHKMRHYDSTISFWNGALVYIGSLENYTAHDGKEFAWGHLDETKDTKEAALTEVIVGRLRQYGLWFDQNGDLHWDDDKANREANLAKGWQSFNPLKIHTSPALGTVEWINQMFALGKFQKEIKRKCQARGRDFFYRKFDNKTVVIYSAYHNEHNLPPGYLANQEKTLITEEKILKLVHGYPFSKDGGEYYPAWNRDKHVTRVQYLPGVPVLTTWDFNVLPHMTCLCAQVEYLLRFIDEVGNKYHEPAVGLKPLEVVRVRFYREYCLKPPENTIESIGVRFGEEHEAGTEAEYFGDGNGLNRIPGLGSMTQFKMVEMALEPYLHSNSKQVRQPNVGVMSRQTLVNDILAGVKYPHIEIVFDEDMTDTIADFEQCKQGPKGKVKALVKDKITGSSFQLVGHETDCVEYLLSELFKDLLKQ